MAAIERRRTIGLDRLINALGMPPCRRHHGPVAGAALPDPGRVPQGMTADDALEELQHIEGIGGVVAEAIHDFFDEPHNVKALGACCNG